jgi:hypothetical protein
MNDASKQLNFYVFNQNIKPGSYNSDILIHEWIKINTIIVKFNWFETLLMYQNTFEYKLYLSCIV